MTETARHRDLTLPYCVGNGCDVGSGGDPVTPECVSIDLPAADFAVYNAGNPPVGQVNLRARADDLPFKDGVLDFVYSSHLLEDFAVNEWPRIIGEWVRVLRLGGTLIILVPEAKKWAEALSLGQPPNTAHKHEATLGELSGLAPFMGLASVREELIENSYTIIFVAQKS